MARKKNAPPIFEPQPFQDVDQPATQSGTPVSQETLTKTEAVTRALNALGKKAMPQDIHRFVLNNFAMDLDLNLINNYKHHILKKRKKTRGPGRKKGPQAAPEAEPVVSLAHNGKAKGKVSLDDLQTIKELTERVGAASLRSLISMLTK